MVPLLCKTLPVMQTLTLAADCSLWLGRRQ